MALIALMAFCAGDAAAAPVKMVRRIQAPLFASPAFVERGGEIKIRITAEDGSEFVAAYLEPLAGGAKLIKLQTGAPKEEGGLLAVSAKVPKAAPAALYDLSVEFSNERWDTQPHAVKLLDSFKKNFDFVQLTDIHFNIQYLKGRDMNKVRRAVLAKINALKPEFVIFTGDLGLDPETYDSDYIDAYEEMTRGLKVPVLMLPGNHEQYVAKRADGSEIDGQEYWKAAYGPLYNSFDYGNMHIVGFDTFDFPKRWRDRRSKEAGFAGTLLNGFIGKEQMDWIRADLKESSSKGKYCVAATHIPLEYFMGGNRKLGLPPKQDAVSMPTAEEFAGLLADSGCRYLLVGHMHYNQTKRYGMLTQLLTMSAGTENGGDAYRWGWRVMHVRGGRVTGETVQSIGLDDVK